MIKATDVANYFLTLIDVDAEDCISNLKLQKLCYYAQGFHLAIYGERMFDETLQAWQYGPVVSSLYHKYKENRDNCLMADSGFDIEVIPAEIRELLDEVYEVYGQYSAWRLKEMTHQEEPWLSSYNKSQNDEISDKVMKEFFKTRLM